MRRRRIALLLAAAAAATEIAHADASGSSARYSAHGVTFSYPSGWIHLPATFEAELGSPRWREGFAPIPRRPAIGPKTARNVIAVGSYHTTLRITAKTLPRFRAFIRSVVSQLAAEAGGRLLSGPRRTAIGPFAGYRFEVSAFLPEGTAVRSRLVFAFDRNTEYFLNCQHELKRVSARAIGGGCDEIMQSFRLAR
jgi:hypothetical protein